VLLTVGTVVRPHGVRGELVVHPRTDVPERRFTPGAALRRADGGATVVSAARPHQGRWLLRLVGVDSREDAEAWAGTDLLVDINPHDEVDDDDFPDAVLVGCAVATTREPDHVLGTVRDVLHHGAQDLLVVDAADAEVLVPFVRAVVPVVDLTQRRILLDPPPGLFPGDAEG
jgi:16S rRNA processing protein RimM